MVDLYLKAFDVAKFCFYNDDVKTWYPKIIDYKNGSRLHDINGIKASSYGGSESESDSLLRLCLDKSLICSLFAFPASNGIGKIDMVVGYIDNKNNKIYDSYSMMNRLDLCHEEFSHCIIPKNAKWIIGATFNTIYRNAIAMNNKVI